MKTYNPSSFYKELCRPTFYWTKRLISSDSLGFSAILSSIINSHLSIYVASKKFLHSFIDHTASGTSFKVTSPLIKFYQTENRYQKYRDVLWLSERHRGNFIRNLK